MLVNGILFNFEALYGLKKKHIDRIESVDRSLLRQICQSPVTAPIESHYIELNLMPLRFVILSRRLLFYWNLLQKDESELARQVLNIQKQIPCKDDWYLQLSEDLIQCKIFLSEKEI